MMTEERKNQLLGNLIFWATEAINNDEEIMNVLHKSVGFTKEELEEFDVEIPEGYFEKAKFETTQKEDDDGVLTETYKVKTPEYIEFGDPWYKDFEPERIAQLMVNSFPRPTDECRVVLTAEPSEHYADMFDCTMSIFIAPATHIETYMQGCVYEGQEVNDRRIGVDTAKYLIDVDGAFDEIHTGADGHWGNHLKIGRNINGNEIVDCEIIRIYMPEEETMDSMRQKFRYFFSDAQQIDNVKERFLEDIDGGDNSEDISDTQEPKMN